GRNRMMRIQPGAQLSLQTPNVPRQFSQTHHNLVARNVDLKKACANIVHCEPGIVKVVQRKWRADQLLAAPLYALRPKAKLTVAVGNKIDQVTVGRPARLIVPTAWIRN